MNKKHIQSIFDKLIIIFLSIQISVVSISIAVSSVSFGIWISLWLVQLIFINRFQPDKKLFDEIKSINFFIVLYIFFEIVSRFFAVYPDGAFNNLKRLLLFLIFYCSIIKIIHFHTLYKILLLNISVVSLISVFEIAKYILKFGELINSMPFSEIRIDYFSYPLTSAEIKMMSLLSVFPLVFSKDNLVLAKKYLVIIFIPVIVSMILTQSRNVLLASTLTLLFYGFFFNKKFLVAMISIMFFSYFFLPQEYTMRAKSIFDLNHPSNESRLNMWNVGLQMFKDHPFTGVADSHIKEIYETYKTPVASGEGVHLHNNFIMILATTGIFGFISFVCLFISIFIKQLNFFKLQSNEINKLLILGSILVMISFQLSGIFEWSFGDHEVMTVFFFLISVPFVIFKIDYGNNTT